MEGRPYAFKSDVWALGCVMYEVLTGKPAFAAKNFPGVAMKVSCRTGNVHSCMCLMPQERCCSQAVVWGTVRC
jgi:serine/threonine protein kinase